jgi:phage anti-repressor protein
MKKNLDDMSPDMFNDAVSSTPIPVFTNASDATKNDTPETFTKVPEVSFDENHIQSELIKIDFDKQTVSARALYDFLESAERFSKWFKRMISYGLVENSDFVAVPFFVSYTKKKTEDFYGTQEGVPFGTPSEQQDIGDFLLTIEAAKHIAMVQRGEKGKQARNYFINIEKLYLKGIFSKQTVEASTPLLENFKNLLVQLETEMSQQQQVQKNYDVLVEKMSVLEKQLAQNNRLHDLKQIYIKQKVDRALTDGFMEVDNIAAVDEISCIGNSRLKIANSLPPIYQMWYSELSDVFSTTDAERIGFKHNMSRTTIFRLLRNQQSHLMLFRKLRYGQYEKFYTVFE